jgi:hypothetical protein
MSFADLVAKSNAVVALAERQAVVRRLAIQAEQQRQQDLLEQAQAELDSIEAAIDRLTPGPRPLFDEHLLDGVHVAALEHAIADLTESPTEEETHDEND